jgi:hypothetical protein
LENLRVLEDGVSAPAGGLLGSGGGGIIVAGLSSFARLGASVGAKNRPDRGHR